MTAFSKMLEDSELLAQRYELRLEQFRLAFAKGSSDKTAAMDMLRYERALHKVPALQAEIRRNILAEQLVG
jgi:hypothetical protein